MKIEQKIVAIYSLIGCAGGFISHYMYQTSSLLAIFLPIGVCLVTLLPLSRFIKERKFRILLFNSLVTFFLVWIMVWIFLFNF